MTRNRQYATRRRKTKPNKPKKTLKSIPTFPFSLIIIYISKKRAHFALFSYILYLLLTPSRTYYVLYLLVPKLFSIVFHIFLCPNESFVKGSYHFYECCQQPTRVEGFTRPNTFESWDGPYYHKATCFVE